MPHLQESCHLCVILLLVSLGVHERRLGPRQRSRIGDWRTIGLEAFLRLLVSQLHLQLMAETRQVLPERVGARSCRLLIITSSHRLSVTLQRRLLRLFLSIIYLKVSKRQIYHRNYERRYRYCHGVHQV
ncbi:unnamed protein product [Chrysodeixis includens]|uniref:Secreted protein n=1 Tax=Chrysodeixis includens TaxID=689277 RepID=A0A9P0BU21_CHRIL|nr:unnamed protein product [Chrysodeixis includens]